MGDMTEVDIIMHSARKLDRDSLSYNTKTLCLPAFEDDRQCIQDRQKETLVHT